MASNFSDMPQELYIEILANLDAISLIRCAMTSKSVYCALKSSSLLVYTIQLHLDGLKDSGTSTTYPDLIESLVRRRQAWLSPEMTEPLIHRTLHDCGACELVGGAFTNSNTTAECLEVIWAPISNGDQGRTLHRPSIGISVRDLTIDPTQDLIILLEDNGMVAPMTNVRIYPIHIRTISTNAIHPLAQQSPLQLFTAHPVTEEIHGTAIDTATLQIARNTVALYFLSSTHKPRVLIFDWTTSELILDSIISFEPIFRFLKYDFGLLDPTYCFVTCPSMDRFGSTNLYDPTQPLPQQFTSLRCTFHQPPMAILSAGYPATPGPSKPIHSSMHHLRYKTIMTAYTCLKLYMTTITRARMACPPFFSTYSCTSVYLQSMRTARSRSRSPWMYCGRNGAH
ncbi:hypothetical protein BJ912DRAFT_172135 [Pholiota molesta]|nr:hypothetical protein BJ912DRAFT_172135 [Pholiota molesta]